jgi:hypothetical protein
MTNGAPGTALVPEWESFEADYVAPGLPAFIVVASSPPLKVFIDQSASRLGATLALPDATLVPPSPLDEVELREIHEGGVRLVEVSTASRALYRSFFRLLTDILTEVVNGAHPLSALEASVTEWRALLQAPDLLSEQRQAGLFGELLILERLSGVLGERALDAWTGPAGQSHDFRIGDREFEVKTTAGTRRIHMINGVTQLVASPGCSLHIVSIMLAQGGTGGLSLGEFADRLAVTFQRWPFARDRFIAQLRSVGYRPEDAARYPRKRRQRAPMSLVQVVDGCPRLTPDALSQLSPAFAAGRIGRVSYQIDLDGMGVGESDPAFAAVLPAPTT